MKKILVLFLLMSVSIIFGQKKENYKVIATGKNAKEIMEALNKHDHEQVEYEQDGITPLNGIYNLNYSSRKLNAKLMFKNGKKNGPAILYYEDGEVRAEVIYKDNLLNGKIISYHNNGKISSEGVYKNGWEDGVHKAYYENGELKSEKNDSDGITLYRKTYDEKGNLEESKELDKFGIEKIVKYDKNGHIDNEIHWKNEKIVFQSFRQFTGKRRNNTTYDINENKTIKVERYFSNGQLEWIKKYKNDKVDGKVLIYDIAGRIRKYEEYSNGVLGKVYNNETYYEKNKKTKLNGEKTFISDNGNKVIEIYKDGKKEGKCEIYDENGKLLEIVFFKNNLENDTSIEYNINGNKLMESNWKNGKLNGKKTEWYSEGEKYSEELYTDGLLDGISISWRRNGEKFKEIEYKKGKLDGIRKVYDYNKVIEYTEYKNGEKHGVERKYDKDEKVKSEKRYINGKEVK